MIVIAEIMVVVIEPHACSAGRHHEQRCSPYSMSAIIVTRRVLTPVVRYTRSERDNICNEVALDRSQHATPVYNCLSTCFALSLSRWCPPCQRNRCRRASRPESRQFTLTDSLVPSLGQTCAAIDVPLHNASPIRLPTPHRQYTQTHTNIHMNTRTHLDFSVVDRSKGRDLAMLHRRNVLSLLLLFPKHLPSHCVVM